MSLVPKYKNGIVELSFPFEQLNFALMPPALFSHYYMESFSTNVRTEDTDVFLGFF